MPRMVKAAAVCGIAGPILFAVAVAALSFLERDFMLTLGWDQLTAPTRDWPSGLALGPGGFAMTAAFLFMRAAPRFFRDGDALEIPNGSCRVGRVDSPGACRIRVRSCQACAGTSYGRLVRAATHAVGWAATAGDGSSGTQCSVHRSPLNGQRFPLIAAGRRTGARAGGPSGCCPAGSDAFARHVLFAG